jgi:NADH:ubiquinone oxidoreductase subunit 5 (subunit L)/multisubunit Na+/H+ antiporter MnhA subunit
MLVVVTLIVFLPLAFFYIDLYMGRLSDVRLVKDPFEFASFYISLAIFVFVFVGVPDDGLLLKESINIGSLRISWSFVLDIWFCIKLTVVTYITSAVQLDFVHNMKRDPRLPRYMCYVYLCGFFLLILLAGNNFTEISITWTT